MAINKLKKVYLFIPRDKKVSLLEQLQKASILHIEKNLRQEIEDETQEKEILSQELDLLIAQAESVINYLHPYKPEKSVLNQIEDLGKTVPFEEFKEIWETFSLKDTYDEVSDLIRTSKDLESEENDLKSRLERFEPYRQENPDFSKIKDTTHTKMVLGSVSTEIFNNFILALDDATSTVVIEKLKTAYFGQDYLFVGYHKDFSNDIEPIFAKFSFKVEDLKAQGLVSESRNYILKRLDEIEKKKSNIIDESIIKAERLKDIRLIYDYLVNAREKKKMENYLYETLSTTIIKGWLKVEDKEKFENIISNVTPHYDVEYLDPNPEKEEVPVEMINKKFFKPAEFLVGLYSLPNYNELDPTTLLYPFFIFFFGICVADAGYGSVLLILSLIGIKLMPKVKLFQVLAVSSCVTIVVGFFLGGFFGTPFENLPAFMQKHAFDVNKHMSEFLVFTLALGALQLVFGHFVGARVAYMHKDHEKMISDILLGIFFACGSPILLLSLFLDKSLPEPYNQILINIAKSAIIVYLVFRFIMALVKYKPKGSPIAKFFGFILALIKGVLIEAFLSAFQASLGFFSNMLSYSRLMALGLASISVGMALNQMAEMIKGLIPVPVLNIIIFVLILIAGHSALILLGALVGFVHSIRLQYVEFFPTFFTGGGKAFEPLAIKTKYNEISIK